MIVAGFGCRSEADADALRAALAAAKPPVLSALATLTPKQTQLAPLAQALGLPLILIDPDRVVGIATPTRSPASLAAYGTGSVAEAVALLAAGPTAHLLAPRSVSPCRSATCALAQGAPE